MNEILIKNQKEYDALPDNFEEYTIIKVITTKSLKITQTPSKNAEVHICGSTEVIELSGSASIKSVSGSASIQSVYDSASIQSVYDSASIQSVYDSASIKYVSGSASIKSVSGSASIQSVYDSASIKSVYGSASIQSVYGNAVIQILSIDVQIFKIRQQTTVILRDCEINLDVSEDVVIVRRQTATHTVESFCDIYSENIQPDGRIKLYKGVNTDDTDFWTGRIKYEGVVTCPDWDPDPERQCGGGLHLSPSLETLHLYTKGEKVKECLVKLEDIMVFPKDITKVRCRAVEVLPEPKGAEE